MEKILLMMLVNRFVNDEFTNMCKNYEYIPVVHDPVRNCGTW